MSGDAGALCHTRPNTAIPVGKGVGESSLGRFCTIFLSACNGEDPMAEVEPVPETETIPLPDSGLSSLGGYATLTPGSRQGFPGERESKGKD